MIKTTITHSQNHILEKYLIPKRVSYSLLSPFLEPPVRNCYHEVLEGFFFVHSLLSFVTCVGGSLETNDADGSTDHDLVRVDDGGDTSDRLLGRKKKKTTNGSNDAKALPIRTLLLLNQGISFISHLADRSMELVGSFLRSICPTFAANRSFGLEECTDLPRLISFQKILSSMIHLFVQ